MRRRGQATLEYVITLAGVLTPLTLGVIALAQMMWIWNSVVDYTRQGARYAATHCWQGGGLNVVDWMRQHPPLMLDQDQFVNGPAEIVIEYYSKNPETGLPEPFTCDGDCSPNCVPESVTVRVRNYEFRRFVGYLGLAPVLIPDFFATTPMEGAGCDPEQGICSP